jgi:hypothetical protein
VTTGNLVITSMTEDVKVYVDGKLVGKTPFEKPVPLKPGKHKLKATRPGYSTLETTFAIKLGRPTELAVDPVPISGLVKFSCNIEGAEVYVDNKLLGHAPLVQEVPVGDHSVQILKEGFNDFVSPINVKGGEKHFVEATLTPFQDLSPEVLAIQAAQKQKEEEAKRAAEALVTAQNAPTVEPWYAGWYKRWWVWAIAGAVVVTAVTIPLATSGGEPGYLDDHANSTTVTIDLGKPSSP